MEENILKKITALNKFYLSKTFYKAVFVDNGTNKQI